VETDELILPHVLLVEDNQINKDVVERFLRKICNIEHSYDGLNAIDMAKSKKYKLILMDINLGPGIDGMETAKRIRTISGYENTAIVAVTGYALAGDREKLLSEGCSHYLAKPFTRAEITDMVVSLLAEVNE